MKVQSWSEVKHWAAADKWEAANWACTIGVPLFPPFLCLLFFSGIFLKGRKTNHSAWVMSRIVCREFSHTTKYCKMFYTFITLGWHFPSPVTGFLFHVILISTGTCANLTSSNWNDLSQRCCPLPPDSPEVMPGKTGSHLQLREATLAHTVSHISVMLPHPCWVYALT